MFGSSTKAKKRLHVTISIKEWGEKSPLGEKKIKKVKKVVDRWFSV